MNSLTSKYRIVAVLCAAALSAAGCNGSRPSRIDHTNPQALVLTLHQAVEERDQDSIVGSVDTTFRGPFRLVIRASADYVDALRSLADLLERRIGPQAAQRYRRLADEVSAGMMPSPWKAPWTTARSTGQGPHSRRRRHERRDDPRQADRVRPAVRRLAGADGLWYVVPRQRASPPTKSGPPTATNAGRSSGRSKRYVNLTKDLEKQVRDGKINAANYEQKMAGLRAATQP